MPLYEYRCVSGHVTECLRRYDDRDEALDCLECGGRTKRIVSAHHRQPDGIYSFEPNVGNPDAHERKAHDIRERNR